MKRVMNDLDFLNLNRIRYAFACVTHNFTSSQTLALTHDNFAESWTNIGKREGYAEVKERKRIEDIRRR